MNPSRKRLVSTALVAIVGMLTVPSLARASITSFDWNEPVALKLVDGRQLEGRFRGMLGQPTDPVDYAARYETWRSTMDVGFTPALGETLIVTRRKGASLRGPFRGFSDNFLLLGTADSCVSLVVPPGKDVQLRRVDEQARDSFPIRQPWKSAPSLYSIALQVQGVTVAVPATKFTSRSVTPHHGSDASGALAVGVVLGVILGAVAMGAAMASAYSHALI
jgi:hypothetical protein